MRRHYGHCHVPVNTHWDPAYTAEEVEYIMTVPASDPLEVVAEKEQLPEMEGFSLPASGKARPATKARFEKTIRARAAQRKSKRGAGGNRRGERRRTTRKTSNLIGEAVNLPTMLILRGIAGHFAGRDWPRGALDEPSAVQYARRRGYVGEVLDVDGATGPKSRQVRMCLEAIRARDDITALYGFSGGGYNVRRVLAALTADERRRIKLIVVLGAPRNPPELYSNGSWELVYRRDPPAGHMAGPKALLAELERHAV